MNNSDITPDMVSASVERRNEEEFAALWRDIAMLREEIRQLRSKSYDGALKGSSANDSFQGYSGIVTWRGWNDST